MPDCRLVLAGLDHQEFSKIIAQRMERYSADERSRIIQVPDFDNDLKKHIYASIDMLVMPSRVDCFGIVYLEAWAFGKPVIACRNFPQETVITSGEDGLLVDYGNVAQISAAILEMLRSPQKRREMGENGRRSLNTKFLLSDYARNMLEIYHQTKDRS